MKSVAEHAADGDEHAEPHRAYCADRSGCAADRPATTLRDAAEQCNPDGRSDVCRGHGVQSAADRVACGGIDDRKRRSARTESRSPGKRATETRAEKGECCEPEAARVGRIETADCLAESIAEEGRAEAEHGEERKGDPCHGQVSPGQVRSDQGCIPDVGRPEAKLERIPASEGP